MKAFMIQLSIQFRIDLREKGILLTFYIIPLVFYLVMGAVFSSINPDSKVTLVGSMVIFGSTMGAVLGIPSPIVKMRESGVFRAYRVSGIPGWSLLIVQGISSFVHIFIVSSIMLITAPLLFGALFPTSYVGFILVLFILLATNISLGLLIGTISKSQSMATMLSQVVFLPSLMLGGIMFPASMLPKSLMILGRAFPATHAMQAFLELAYGMEGDADPYLSLLIMLIIGAVSLGVATWRFLYINRN